MNEKLKYITSCSMFLAKTCLLIFLLSLSDYIPNHVPKLILDWWCSLLVLSQNSSLRFTRHCRQHLYRCLRNSSISAFQIQTSYSLSKNSQFHSLIIIFLLICLSLHCQHPSSVCYYLSLNSTITNSFFIGFPEPILGPLLAILHSTARNIISKTKNNVFGTKNIIKYICTTFR